MFSSLKDHIQESDKFSNVYFVLNPLQAFAPASFARPSTVLEACRVNAKKEKRQRNRENMRKFSKKRGPSRKKMMRKVQSNAMREVENEFVAKLFMATEAAEE